MNFAGVFKAPIVFFCKNNQYAISLPVSRQTASPTIAIKAIAYGFQGIRVDGNDILAVYTVTKEAVDKARRGEGPTLIEAVTYRLGAHSTSDDPSRYRSQEEVELARKNDPLKRFKIYLESKGLWNDDEENETVKKIEEEINMIINEMENTPPPDPKTLFEDVYAEIPWHLKEQMELLLEELKSKKEEIQEAR
jgi:TPP-dependent pyruvate/acetoin dehydrogenase alpha subunit